MDGLDQHTLDMIKKGHWRVVRNPRRRRLLFNRGEYIVWNEHVNGWIWIPFRG